MASIRHVLALVFLFAVAAISGCQQYHPSPLLPTDVVNAVDRERHPIATQTNPIADGDHKDAVESSKEVQPLTFVQAAAMMRDHSPELHEVQAAYRTTLALANVKTPLPNPSVTVGPQFGFGPGVLPFNRTQPFGSIGFTLPTNKKFRRQDELNRAMADMAQIEYLARHRELYLELRKDYSRLFVDRTRLVLRKTVADSAAKSVDLSRKLVESGQASLLDAGLLQLEYIRFKTDTIGARTDIAGVEGDLSQLVGVGSETFQSLPSNALPEIPAALPSLEDLKAILIANQNDLARLRARYDVAERQLRLEIAKQYPDFRFGPNYMRDPADTKSIIGLSLGIDLPVFDRNQQAVATACQQREEIRAKYEAAANKSLAKLERSWQIVELTSERMKIVKDELAPKANSNLELSIKQLMAGQIDSLRFLETERAQRSAIIDAVEAELALREAWIDLEQAVGFPLMKFPDEDARDFQSEP